MDTNRRNRHERRDNKVTRNKFVTSQAENHLELKSWGRSDDRRCPSSCAHQSCGTWWCRKRHDTEYFLWWSNHLDHIVGRADAVVVLRNVPINLLEHGRAHPKPRFPRATATQKCTPTHKGTRKQNILTPMCCASPTSETKNNLGILTSPTRTTTWSSFTSCSGRYPRHMTPAMRPLVNIIYFSPVPCSDLSHRIHHHCGEAFSVYIRVASGFPKRGSFSVQIFWIQTYFCNCPHFLYSLRKLVECNPNKRGRRMVLACPSKTQSARSCPLSLLHRSPLFVSDFRHLPCLFIVLLELRICWINEVKYLARLLALSSFGFSIVHFCFLFFALLLTCLWIFLATSSQAWVSFVSSSTALRYTYTHLEGFLPIR